MATKYTSGNILYTNVVKPSFLTTGRLAKGTYTIENNEIVNKPGPFVNAIDIDWNGAYLESIDTYINTTSDLLEQINNIYISLENINDSIDLSDYLKTNDLPTQLTVDLLTDKLNNIYASKDIESNISDLESEFSTLSESLDNKANKDEIPNIDDFLNQLDEIYAPKSVEQSISNLSNALDNKANKDEIPTKISDLEGFDDFATISWVNNQFRYYAKTPYDVYKQNRIDEGLSYMSESEWLESLKGTNGINGKSAYELALQYSITDINNEYDWVRSLQGKNGLSAFQIAQQYNPTLETEEEWLASLKGETGDDGNDGINGKSAFELAKDNGFEGTEEEWLASLKGEKGEQGEKGEMGAGINILGYYDTLEELKEATRDTINSIGDSYNVGGTFYVYNDEFGGDIDEKWKPAGSLKGDPGKSAFEIYKELGGVIDNEEDWLASLKGDQGATGIKGDKGDKGDPGNDIYQVYYDLQHALGNEPLSLNDWVSTLGVNTTYTAGEGIQISENNVISVIFKEAPEFWTLFND